MFVKVLVLQVLFMCDAAVHKKPKPYVMVKFLLSIPKASIFNVLTDLLNLNMPNTYVKTKISKYTEEDINNAVLEVNAVSNSPNVKYSNPNFMHDRNKTQIHKPHMPDSWKDRHRQPFNDAWMDYCDPYHCDDYHKTTCGLNRHKMKFKWFQSGCHLIINNQCSTYRGALKYDIVDVRYCQLYVLHLRTACPTVCGKEVEPTCALNPMLDQAVLFRNRCNLDMVNCKAVAEGLDGYEEVDTAVCYYYLRRINK